VGTVVLAWLAVGTARAPADVSCSYDGGTRTATISLLGGIGYLLRDGQKIMFEGAQCGSATMGNTDTIDVEGSIVPDELDLSESQGRFAGIHFDLHLSDSDYLDIFRGDTNDVITVGDQGVSLDNDNTLDMAYVGGGQPIVHINTAGGSDRISGQGGHGTGGPTSVPLSIVLYMGGDVVHGGNGPDQIARFELGSAPTADRIYGEGGDDTTALGWTDDGTIISGGSGTDTVAGGADGTPLDISLDGVANDGEPGRHNNVLADVENLRGGDGDDVLIGDNGSNQIIGGGGNDQLVGGWGPDQLIGGNGDDTIEAGNGMSDGVMGGNGNDTAVVDCGTPADRVVDVETTTCAAPPPEAPYSVSVTFAWPPGGHLSATDPATVPLVATTQCATAGCDSGICDTRWRLRTDGGPWVLLPAAAPQPTLTRSFPLGAGDIYQLQASSVTCDGIVGLPKAGRPFTVRGTDESAASFSPEWSPVSDTAAWGGALEQSGPAGTATFGFSGFQVAWIGQRGPSLGPGTAKLDGSACPGVTEYAASTQERRLIAICGGTQKAHQLVVGPSARSAGSTVDGFVVLAYP
jgi:Ca2+-binding RTX toxin-like protein